MNYYELIDSGSKMIKSNDKNYLKSEKELFKKHDTKIYGMKDIYSKQQLYLIAILSIILILMFPFGFNEQVQIYKI